MMRRTLQVTVEDSGGLARNMQVTVGRSSGGLAL